MSNDQQSAAIACNLSATEYHDRIAWIEDLNKAALRDYRRDGRRIELGYGASEAVRVREFVQRERQCCPFLEFAVRRGDDRIVVTIVAPPEVGESADALFECYITGNRG